MLYSKALQADFPKTPTNTPIGPSLHGHGLRSTISLASAVGLRLCRPSWSAAV
jgi:hypothetical protein